ncbi:MAG: 23S rRNA (adenine(2503)-C(2))-methyltransferase RlmN [Terracidiphilus sp.]
MTGNPSRLVSLDAESGPRGSLRPLFGLDSDALAACMVEAGEPGWRGRQLAEALYRQRVTDLGEITTLSKTLRTRLIESGWQVGRPSIVNVFTSTDGTERYLVRGQDEQTVETVWMPEGDGGEIGDGSEADIPQDLGAPSFRRFSGERVGDHESATSGSRQEASESHQESGKTWSRATICVSSQVGCAVNCQFCLTAKLGFQRNLSAGEIAGQVVAVLDRQRVEVGRDRTNLVFMGMGEPFLNYDNFMAAVRLLVNEVGISPQRMTVSTSGIVPGIERFAREPDAVRPKLAISLNAPNDAVRGEVMPINRKWPVDAVVEAVRAVPLRPRERVTFEYVLLGGVTDRPEHAAEVARLVRKTGLPAKVNLIAWNPGPGIDYTMPSAESVEVFRRKLADAGIPVYLRRPRGRDIFAACGQLKRTVERPPG